MASIAWLAISQARPAMLGLAGSRERSEVVVVVIVVIVVVGCVVAVAVVLVFVVAVSSQSTCLVKLALYAWFLEEFGFGAP
jgi:hypothetical protein